MTPAQIEKLAEKNREKSQSEMLDEEMKKRGRTRPKRKRKIYVDRSLDPSFNEADHSTIFREMKKKPYHE